MRPLIEVRGLSYKYEDGTVALDGIDFQLMPGETVALFGANGSGKTTFILHLNGLLEGEGAVTICGMPLRSENLVDIRNKVGMVFQDSDEQLSMPSVLEDVAFGPLHQGMSSEQAKAVALQALNSVGMDHIAMKAPYHLSAGEKKRVAIAGVLAMNPEILVLDEPTTFLDPPSQRDLIQLLRGLPQAKVIVTHDTRFAAALASRAVFFEKGKIRGVGEVEQVINQFNWSPQNTPNIFN